MTIDHLAQLAVAILLGGIGAIVWFVRLEGRLNLLDRVLMDSLQDRKDAMVAIHAHLNRLEQKLDRIALRCAAFSGLHELHEEKEDKE